MVRNAGKLITRITLFYPKKNPSPPLSLSLSNCVRPCVDSVSLSSISTGLSTIKCQKIKKSNHIHRLHQEFCLLVQQKYYSCMPHTPTMNLVLLHKQITETYQQLEPNKMLRANKQLVLYDTMKRCLLKRIRAVYFGFGRFEFEKGEW